MSLLKPKEKGTRPALTMLDLVRERFETIVKKNDERNQLARANIEKLGVDREKIRGELVALEEKISPLTAEYKTILAEMTAAEQKRISEDSVTENDLAEHRVNVREFVAVGKKNEQILAEAKTAAEAKLEKARAIIRRLRRGIYERLDQAAMIDEKITQLNAEVALDFYNSLDGMRKELEAAGVGRGWLTTAHHLSQERKNDWGMSAKGAILWHAKSWTVKTIDEAELLALDPILQEQHFGEFGKFIESIRKLDFSELTINYTPSEFGGRPAGDFWYSFRPTSLPARGKIGELNVRP